MTKKPESSHLTAFKVGLIRPLSKRNPKKRKAWTSLLPLQVWVCFVISFFRKPSGQGYLLHICNTHEHPTHPAFQQFFTLPCPFLNRASIRCIEEVSVTETVSASQPVSGV